MKQTELKGIITPILTPMNADESINTDELRTQIDRLIDGGVHGIFPFGTNGEGYILNEKEKCEVLEAAKQREVRKSARRVDNLFTMIERKEGIREISFC